jgi:hypothetical protein
MKCAEALQSLRAVQDEFALRYYRWSQMESEREIAEGFPLTRKVKSSSASLFIDFAEESPREVVRKLMTGNLKRFNSRGAEIAVDVLSSEEEAARQLFLEYLTPEVTLNGQKMTSRRVSPRASQVRERESQGQTSGRLDKKRLKQALMEALEPVLAKPERAPAGGLHYCLPIDRWYLITSLDLSGKKQLYYGHWISARRRIDSCPANLYSEISPLSWSGIERNTSFNLIEAQDVDNVASFVSEMCKHFIHTARKLLSRLDHSVPEILSDAVPVTFERT